MADFCRNSLSIEVADVEFLCSMHMQAGDGHFLFEFFVSLLFENPKESAQ
jgi:hypothetical protein